MYDIYANIWGILMVNVTIYGIHGSYGYYTAYYILNHQPNKIHNPRINAPLNANVLQFKFMAKNRSWKPQSSMVSGHLGRSVLQDHVHGFNEPATAGEFETDLIKMLLVERLEKETNGSIFLNTNYFCNMNSEIRSKQRKCIH